LTTRVLRRSAEGGNSVTLMEIYSFDNGKSRGVHHALRARIDSAAAALSPMLTSPRQVEPFDVLD